MLLLLSVTYNLVSLSSVTLFQFSATYFNVTHNPSFFYSTDASRAWRFENNNLNNLYVKMSILEHERYQKILKVTVSDTRYTKYFVIASSRILKITVSDTRYTKYFVIASSRILKVTVSYTHTRKFSLLPHHEYHPSSQCINL